MKLFLTTLIAVVFTISANARMTKAVEVENNSTNKTQVYNIVTDNNEFLKYEYTIDNNDRVIGKVCYHYSQISHNWEPDYIYTASYENGISKLSYAKWNQASKSFSTNVQVQNFNEPFKELLTLPAE